MHGIPGLLGGIISALVLTGYQSINDKYYAKTQINLYFDGSLEELPQMAGIQIAGTFICLGVALVIGIGFGFLLKALRSFEIVQSMDVKDGYSGI